MIRRLVGACSRLAHSGTANPDLADIREPVVADVRRVRPDVRGAIPSPAGKWSALAVAIAFAAYYFALFLHATSVLDIGPIVGIGVAAGSSAGSSESSCGPSPNERTIAGSSCSFR